VNQAEHRKKGKNCLHENLREYMPLVVVMEAVCDVQAEAEVTVDDLKNWDRL
jgi:hypothetical protein